MLAQTLKGFRDFLPTQKRLRDRVIQTIQSVFELFGFEGLETPALEYDDILSGKYGAEGERLRYHFTDHGGRQVGLRYDLTVPLSRVIAEHRSEIVFPFKRYQIQPVWRAENTQKGRYREFYQCDFDTVGSRSPLADAEIPAVYAKALEKLGFDNFSILYNSRQSLSVLLEKSRIPEDLRLRTLNILDKLDKIGSEEVAKELIRIGLAEKQTQELMSQLKEISPDESLTQIVNLATKLGVQESKLKFSPTLVRGLDYYTGPIFEAVIDDSNIGSVGGAGRYDELIAQIGETKIPATGGSIGLERIIDSLTTKDQTGQPTRTKVLLTLLTDKASREKTLELSDYLRANDVNCELFPDESVKLEKQISFASKKSIPFLIILGEQEVKQGLITLKDLTTGNQESIKKEALLAKVS